jgi:hypothetical protein
MSYAMTVVWWDDYEFNSRKMGASKAGSTRRWTNSASESAGSLRILVPLVKAWAFGMTPVEIDVGC